MKRKIFVCILLSSILIVTAMSLTTTAFAGSGEQEAHLVSMESSSPKSFSESAMLAVDDAATTIGQRENTALLATGDNVKWSISENTLTISGSGKMKDYGYGEAPWYQQAADIKKIVIKSGITRIGQYAFYGFYNTIDVTIPSTVKTIGRGAFYDCSSLESVTLPNSVKTLEAAAFANCYELKSFVATGLTSVEDYAFQSTPLESFKISKGLTSLSTLAFFDGNIKQFEIADGNTAYSVQDGVVYTNQKKTLYLYPAGSEATSFVIPKGVTKIGANAFLCSQNLESVTFCKTIKTIGESAFCRSESLKELTLPDSVKTIGDFAFAYCGALEKIVFGTGAKKGSYRMLESCYELKDVDFGGLQTLDAQTFVYCTSLKKIVLPKTITEIGVGNFGECTSLTSFTSKGLDCIPYQTFFNCKKLSEVKLNYGIKDIYDLAFYGCKKLKTLTVPKSTNHVYSEAVPKTTKIICKNKKLAAYGENGRWYIDNATIKASRKYDYAFQVLTLVNKERKSRGLSPLKMNESLLKSAMIRGGETAILYSHTRPDGRDPFTINSLMMAENIAAGQTTPKQVVNDWMNSPGHRANILDSEAKIIGIGCVKHNGNYYWVQCFGTTKQTKNCAKPKNTTVYQNIPYVARKISINEGGEYRIKPSIYLSKTTLKKGKSLTAKVKISNPTLGWTDAQLTNKGIQWSSSNKKIATVSSSGKIKALKPGKVTITAKTKQYTLKKTITIKK